MKFIKRLLSHLISAVYPDKCIGCGEILDNSSFLCNNCYSNIEKVSSENICIACGLEKSECTCKYNVFRFNGLLCSFKNTGIARKTYYKYKFGRKQHYARYFINEICNDIKYCYKDIDFDVVCAVPAFKRFGYDHSGYVARLIALELQIPFDNRVLRCVKRVKKQHRSTIKERLNNVDGKYRAQYRVSNKKILLIDDIKTTGATLDECAKILLFAGAECVYCATILGSVQDNN